MEATIKLVLLTAIAMLAFATNSLLNRFALSGDEIGPGGFAFVRVVAGSIVLIILVAARKRRIPRIAPPRPIAIAGLVAYMLGFSFAYVSMDAGLGALLLFGGVQVTMFAGALVDGAKPSPRQWVGMVFALTGLALLTAPTQSAVIEPEALALMICAAIGWGFYSLSGRAAMDPLAETCWNFTYCLPLVLIAYFVWPDTSEASAKGFLLAIVSGGLTSALGYALWYALLPALGTTRGALVQLSVPVITLSLSALFLGETITIKAVVAALMILGGIAFGLISDTGRNKMQN